MGGLIFSHSSQFLTIRVAEFSAAEDLFLIYTLPAMPHMTIRRGNSTKRHFFMMDG